MLAEWAARPSQPIQPTSTNQKTLFATANLSLMHYTEDIQIPMNPFCARTLKLTIMWYHMVTMTLRGLTYNHAKKYFAHVGSVTVAAPELYCTVTSIANSGFRL